MSLAKNYSLDRIDFGSVTKTPLTRGLVLNGMQVEIVRVTKLTGDTTGSVALSAVQRPNAVYAIPIVDSGTQGTAQVETAVIVGTVGGSGAGNVTVTVTSPLLPSSPKAISVAVANNDTASQVATKIRTALNADPEVGDHFDVGGSAANVSLTAKVAAANDATLNIAYANDTSSGLTNDATSDNTTAGVAPATAEPTIVSVTFTHTNNTTIGLTGLGTWTSALLLVAGRSYKYA